ARGVASAVVPFRTFGLLAAPIYPLNAVAARESARRHPQKRHRPVASGRLSARAALVVGVALIVGSLAAGATLSRSFLLVALAYVGLLTAYSLWLKDLVIVDVLVVAGGFVLRAVAGGPALDVGSSGWPLICTILIALFLALGKRRHEYVTLAGEAAAHRPILAEYSAELLDQMIAVVTASTVTAYALYTMSPETVAKFHTHLLPVTLSFVLYGIFRYLYLLYRRQLGGNPSELFLNDRALLVNTVLWMLAVVVIIYGPWAR